MSAGSAGHVVLVERSAQGIVTLHNNNPMPTLSINDMSVVKGSSLYQNVNFVVTLSAASGIPASAAYPAAVGIFAAVALTADGASRRRFHSASPKKNVRFPMMGPPRSPPISAGSSKTC